LILTTQVFAQNWTQWRGANRDGKVTGFAEPEKYPIELVQNWKITVGMGDSTPALVGDKLYVFVRQGDKEVTLCLDANSGKELWRDEYQAQAVTGAASRHPGPRSSPDVSDGKVFTIGVGGMLSCLDADTGKLLWRKDPFPGLVPKFFTAMSPMIVDGMCIAHLGTAGNGAIIAYDINSGNEKWRWTGEGPEYSSPVLLMTDDSKQIVTIAEKSVVGIDAVDGSLLWQIPFAPQGRGYNAATPIIEGQTVIFTGSSRGTNAVKIEKQNGNFVPKELWSNKEVAVQFNTPVLKNGLLFGFSDKDNLFCIDAKTGQTKWVDQTRRGRGGFSSILDVGSVLMALPSNSELTVFKPNGEEYMELMRIKVSDAETYAHPVISGNKIYIKDLETLAMWTIK
ncbi:MAG: PQQ-binding-like beta-propeller repeat protein, partial [Candidatus Poribacteria bacterium]